MHIPRRHLTQHRFQRIILWTLAVLTWIAATLSDNRAVSARHQSQRFDISLPWLTQLVSMLLIVRAAQLARRRRQRVRYWRHGRDLRRAHLMRAALGARLRRKLKHKNPRAWIATLIAVLRDLDTHAGPLARRLRCGLTRLWRTWTAVAQTPLLFGPPGAPPALADSS